MLVHNYDPATGEYIGSSAADESPREPGVFVLPGFATFDAPPETVPDAHYVAWTGSAWDILPLPEEPEPEPEPEPTPPLELPLDRLTFWLVAASAGVSTWAVRAQIEAMPEDTPDDKLQKYSAIAWFEEANQYRRYDPVLTELAAGVGLTSEELDALWVYAVM